MSPEQLESQLKLWRLRDHGRVENSLSSANH